MSESLADWVARFARDGVWELVPSARERATAAAQAEAAGHAAAERVPRETEPEVAGENGAGSIGEAAGIRDVG